MSVEVAVVGPGAEPRTQLARDREVKVACDLAADQLVRIKRRYPEGRTTSRFDSVLADPVVDAVVVATPVSTHFAIARPCVADERRAAEALDPERETEAGLPAALAAFSARTEQMLAEHRNGSAGREEAPQDFPLDELRPTERTPEYG